MFTEEEKQIALQRLKDINSSIDRWDEELEEDANIARERWEKIMQAIGNLTTAVELLTYEVRNAKGEIRREHKEAVSKLTETSQTISEELAPKKIIWIKKDTTWLDKIKKLFMREGDNN